MCHGDEFFHDAGFVFVVFIIEEYLTFGCLAVQLIVVKIFKGWELADKNIADESLCREADSTGTSRRVHFTEHLERLHVTFHTVARYK